MPFSNPWDFVTGNPYIDLQPDAPTCEPSYPRLRELYERCTADGRKAAGLTPTEEAVVRRLLEGLDG